MLFIEYYSKVFFTVTFFLLGVLLGFNGTNETVGNI